MIDQAVARRLIKKPPTIIVATFAISKLSPKLGARGIVTNDGTKNTGSHFVNTFAPGLRMPYRGEASVSSPSLFVNVSKANKDANRNPQPARLEGKLMDNFLNNFLNKISIRIKAVVERTGFKISDSPDVVVDVVVDGVCVSRES